MLPKTSKPAERALQSIGVGKLEQLTAVTEAELLSLHGMGPKAMGILRHALKARGLRFKAPPSRPRPASH